jgi:hypothetical protein
VFSILFFYICCGAFVFSNGFLTRKSLGFKVEICSVGRSCHNEEVSGHFTVSTGLWSRGGFPYSARLTCGEVLSRLRGRTISYDQKNSLDSGSAADQRTSEGPSLQSSAEDQTGF